MLWEERRVEESHRAHTIQGFIHSADSILLGVLMSKVWRAANQRPWEGPPDGGGRREGQNGMNCGMTSCDQGHVRKEQRDSVQIGTLGGQWGVPGSSMGRESSGLGELR